MRLFLIVFAMSCFGAVATKGRPPQIEPFGQAFDRFCKEYVVDAGTIVMSLRPAGNGGGNVISGDLEVLDRYLRNLVEDDIPGLRRAEHEGVKGSTVEWLRRLRDDVVGFRRTLDHYIIVKLWSGDLRSDEALRKRLEKSWKDEEYFAWRFSFEAEQRIEKGF